MHKSRKQSNLVLKGPGQPHGAKWLAEIIMQKLYSIIWTKIFPFSQIEKQGIESNSAQSYTLMAERSEKESVGCLVDSLGALNPAG